MKRAWLLGALLAVVAWTAHASQSGRGGVQFNHRIHYQALGLDCTGCHEVGHEGRDVSLPREEYCLGCHDGRLVPSDCSHCHDQAEAPTGYRRVASELIFSHPEHLVDEGVDCLSCHSDLPTAGLSGAGSPAMETCFTCHAGVRQTTECVACHTDPGRVTARIHPAGWQEGHRVAANMDQPSCEPCHRTDDRCSLCHAGDNYRGEIHPFNWLVLHAPEARARRQDCTTCHDTRAFCVACHVSRRAIPIDHLVPDWLARHADEARFDLETCDACHGTDQPSCYRSGCHGF